MTRRRGAINVLCWDKMRKMAKEKTETEDRERKAKNQELKSKKPGTNVRKASQVPGFLMSKEQPPTS